MTDIRATTVLPARRAPITLTTEDGLRLVGELALPADRDPVATLVCLHPLPTHGGMMDSHVYRKAASRLPALADLAVLRFNTRGTESEQGKSEGEFGGGETERLRRRGGGALRRRGRAAGYLAARLVVRHGADAALGPAAGRPGRHPALPAAAPRYRPGPGPVGGGRAGRSPRSCPSSTTTCAPTRRAQRFARVPKAEVIGVDGAKHLWVGENYVRIVLAEIVRTVNPAALHGARDPADYLGRLTPCALGRSAVSAWRNATSQAGPRPDRSGAPLSQQAPSGVPWTYSVHQSSSLGLASPFAPAGRGAAPLPLGRATGAAAATGALSTAGLTGAAATAGSIGGSWMPSWPPSSCRTWARCVVMLSFWRVSSSTSRWAASRRRSASVLVSRQQLVGLRLGLGDDLVGVLLRVRHELARVLVGVAAGLVGLRGRLGGPLLGGGRALLRLGDQLLRGGLGGGEPLGLLPLGLLAAGGELDLELRLGLRPLRLALVEDALRLATASRPPGAWRW